MKRILLAFLVALALLGVARTVSAQGGPPYLICWKDTASPFHWTQLSFGTTGDVIAWLNAHSGDQFFFGVCGPVSGNS